MDPEMVQVTIGGQGDLSPAATLTTATAGQQPTDKYFLEPINTLQLYPKPSKTTAADARMSQKSVEVESEKSQMLVVPPYV